MRSDMEHSYRPPRLETNECTRGMPVKPLQSRVPAASTGIRECTGKIKIGGKGQQPLLYLESRFQGDEHANLHQAEAALPSRMLSLIADAYVSLQLPLAYIQGPRHSSCDVHVPPTQPNTCHYAGYSIFSLYQTMAAEKQCNLSSQESIQLIETTTPPQI